MAPLLVRDTGLSPIDADAPPVFRVYGPAGLLVGITGSCTILDAGLVSSASSTTPIVYTTTVAHNLTSGFVVTVSGVVGNTGANRNGICTAISPTTFSLASSIGMGLGSGGSWNMTGLYTYTFDVTTVNGFEIGTLYVVVIEGVSGGITFSYTQTFQIN